MKQLPKMAQPVEPGMHLIEKMAQPVGNGPLGASHTREEPKRLRGRAGCDGVHVDGGELQVPARVLRAGAA